MILTISGTPGSGKSTVAKILSHKLGLKRYYMGQIFRDLAARMGIPVQDYVKLGETDESIDSDVDLYQKEIAKNEDNIILEGRTSFIMAPGSVKIFIFCDIDTGVRRIFGQISSDGAGRHEGSYSRWEDLKPEIEKRMQTDLLRYRKYYKVDAFDHANFDIVIDSTNMAADEVAKKIIDKINAGTYEP